MNPLRITRHTRGPSVVELIHISIGGGGGLLQKIDQARLLEAERLLESLRYGLFIKDPSIRVFTE